MLLRSNILTWHKVTNNRWVVRQVDEHRCAKIIPLAALTNPSECSKASPTSGLDLKRRLK